MVVAKIAGSWLLLRQLMLAINAGSWLVQFSVNDWGSSGDGDDGGESVDVNGSSNVVRLNFLLLDIFQFGNQTFDNV